MTVPELEPGHVELLGDEGGEVLAAGGHVVVGVHGAARAVVGAPHVSYGDQLLHSALELQTKVHVDFTITEKASTRAIDRH